jgi:hypothetical protein
MGKTTSVEVPPAVRWSLWLLAGSVVGVVLGFAFGLARPRIKE